MTNEKKDSGFKFIMILLVVITIGTLIAGLVVMFMGLNIGDPIGTDFEQLQLGLYLIYGSCGLMVLGFPTVMCIWLNRRRHIMVQTMQSMKTTVANIAYPTFSQAFRAKRSDFCEYCGFEVLSGERECPECGGPIKRGLK